METLTEQDVFSCSMSFKELLSSLHVHWQAGTLASQDSCTVRSDVAESGGLSAENCCWSSLVLPWLVPQRSVIALTVFHRCSIAVIFHRVLV